MWRGIAFLICGIVALAVAPSCGSPTRSADAPVGPVEPPYGRSAPILRKATKLLMETPYKGAVDEATRRKAMVEVSRLYESILPAGGRSADSFLWAAGAAADLGKS